MNLQNKNLVFAFLSTLSLTLFIPALFPSLRLNFFVPFLIILYYQRPFLNCLWFSFLCGMILDLLSSHPRLGVFTVSYCLTTALLFGQRRNFFADSVTTMPIMTYFFCFLSTLLQAVLIYIFDRGLSLSWGWVIADLFLMPVLDACYAFGLFILPSFLFGKPQKRGKEYFL
jgi:rod shape-determining protein MreD